MILKFSSLLKISLDAVAVTHHPNNGIKKIRFIKKLNMENRSKHIIS